jgi:uncharacterized protein (TIRG00374 family)
MHRLARAAVGSVLGVLALWLAFRGVDPALVWQQLSAVPLPNAGATVGVVVLTVAAIVVRWRIIVAASSRAAGWQALTAAVLIGQATNIVLPFRVGEFARAYALARTSSLPFQFVLATIAVERIADVAGLLASATALSFMTLPTAVPHVSSRSIAVGAAILALVALLSIASGYAGATAARVRERIVRSFSTAAPALEGFRALRHRGVAVAVAGMTIVIVGLAAATNYVLFAGFGLVLPAAAALVLLVLLQLGTTIASVPGNLGVFHYMTVLVLTAYGVDRASALAYAWALYLLTTVPRIALGALCMALGPGRVDSAMAS